MKTENKGLYIFLAMLLVVILVLNLLLMIIIPSMIIVEILAAVCEYFTIKKIKKINESNNIRLKQEEQMLGLGYNKIIDGLFINEENRKINIMGKDYDFTQVIDCKLIENNSSISNTYEKTRGKIKSNGKIRAKSNTFSNETIYCNEMYINIVVDDLNNPSVNLNVRNRGMLIVGSQKYKENYNTANKVLATLKLIISKAKEKSL